MVTVQLLGNNDETAPISAVMMKYIQEAVILMLANPYSYSYS